MLARVDPKTGERTDIAFCPGFLRGLAIHNGYAIATVSLPRDGAFAGLALQDELKKRDGEPWCGVCIVDLRSGDLVEWIRLNGAIKELFDVAVIPETQLPDGARRQLARHPEPDLLRARIRTAGRAAPPS